MTWTPPRPEVRDPWYRAIIKHPTLTNATKLLLVVLVDDMRLDGYVSVPRSVLAKKLGVHEARITERIKEAVDAKVLDVVVKGRPGVTSEYRAVLPVGTPVRTKRARRRLNADGAPVRTTDMVRSLYQAEVHPSAPSPEREHGAPVQSASTTHSPFAECTSVVGEKRNDEKTTEAPNVNAYGIGTCVVCNSFEKLGPDGLCSQCVVSPTAKANAS